MEEKSTKEARYMNIIDIHAHVYPDNIAYKAAESIRQYYQIGRDMDGTPQMLMERGRQAGVTKFVILPVAIRADKVRSINDFIYQQTQEHDCFVGLGTVHADFPDIPSEVERILSMGLKGVKLHPDCQKFNIDDPRLFPLYESIQGRIPVFLHMGDKRYDYSHPQRLKRLLELFPRLQVIAAHFGGYSMYETAFELLNKTDCVFDVSSSLMFMGDGVAEKYIRAFGAERMAFGTDYPLWDPVQETQRFLQLKLTDAEFDQISHKTAERILKL